MKELNLQEVIDKGNGICKTCGHMHQALVKDVIIESGAINKIVPMLRKYNGTKPFILCDKNTYKACAKDVAALLDKENIPYVLYMMDIDRCEPDEKAIGSVFAHYDKSTDFIMSVGSGVLNDLGKILANVTNKTYMIVGTAPSMDGYASCTSSIIRDGLKYSLPSKSPEIVIGDLDVLCASPMRMIQAGIGDLLAKIVSIREWQIANIIVGEYYCHEIADLVNQALDICLENLDGVLLRDKKAIKAVMDGMVLAGISANFALSTRPVSGLEHYYSHIIDMRGVEFKTYTDFHGIQVGVGTASACYRYEKLRGYKIDKEKALAYARNFDVEKWNSFLREHLGKGAEAMIALEKKEGKYDVLKHEKRLEVIISNWDKISKIISSFPTGDEIRVILKRIDAPSSFEDLGFTKEDERNCFLMSKDIRDKYVGSRLFWDLGIIDE